MEKSFSMNLHSVTNRLKYGESLQAAITIQEASRRFRFDEGGEEESDALSRGELAFKKESSEEMREEKEWDKEVLVAAVEEEREVFSKHNRRMRGCFSNETKRRWPKPSERDALLLHLI